jgi:CRISPR-associated protein Cmr1
MATQSITFNCEIITPMFIGNAMPGQCELRPSAIKGALRFWWRAMNGNLVKQKQNGEYDYTDLRNKEAEIFGSADEKIGKSKLIITIENDCIDTDNAFRVENTYKLDRRINKGTEREMLIKVNLLEYLAFGPVVKVGQNIQYRKYFPPNSTNKFKIIFSYTEGLDLQPIKCALLLCSVFGGLGSRVRNGFGRFFIEGLANSEDSLKQLLTSVTNLQNFTSLSSGIKLFALQNSYTTWENVLCELGEKYFKARVKYQANNNVISKNLFGIEDERKFEHRPYLGAPLMAFNNPQPLITTNGDSVMLDRHSKSHFFGISKVNDRIYGYILHLPYNYLHGYTIPSGNNRIPLPNRANYETAYFAATNFFNNSLSSSTKQNMRTIIT